MPFFFRFKISDRGTSSTLPGSEMAPACASSLDESRFATSPVANDSEIADIRRVYSGICASSVRS